MKKYIFNFFYKFHQSVQLLSHVWLFATRWTAARQASLSITNSWSLLSFMSVEVVILSNHHLSSPSPPAFNLSQHQGLFQWGSSSHQVATVLEFQLLQGIFRTDFLYNWLVWSPCCPRDSQESSPTAQLKSINSLCSAFFIVQLSHSYMTTEKSQLWLEGPLSVKLCLCFLICCPDLS